MKILSLDAAYRMVEAGVSAARRLDVAACVAVVDASGYVVMKARMDEAGFITTRLAEDKAYTAAAVNMATADLQEMVRPSNELYGLQTEATARFVALPGGLPLKVDGRLLGGVGVSGGSVQQDLEIAQAMVAALEVAPAAGRA